MRAVLRGQCRRRVQVWQHCGLDLYIAEPGLGEVAEKLRPESNLDSYPGRKQVLLEFSLYLNQKCFVLKLVTVLYYLRLMLRIAGLFGVWKCDPGRRKLRQDK